MIRGPDLRSARACMFADFKLVDIQLVGPDLRSARACMFPETNFELPRLTKSLQRV